MLLRCSRTWVCRCYPEPLRATMCVYLLTAKRDLGRHTPWWERRWGGHWNYCMALYIYFFQASADLNSHIGGNSTVTNRNHAALQIGICGALCSESHLIVIQFYLANVKITLLYPHFFFFVCCCCRQDSIGLTPRICQVPQWIVKFNTVSTLII